MKALTIWQPWATLIMEGAKTHEFRSWRPPAALIGRRIVIHSGKRTMKPGTVAQIEASIRNGLAPFIALRVEQAAFALSGVANGRLRLLFGYGLGTAMLGTPVGAAEIVPDDLRPGVDPRVWAWPLSDPQLFAEPILCRGAQGLWEWPAAE